MTEETGPGETGPAETVTEEPTSPEPRRPVAPRGLLGIGAGGLVLEALVLLLAAPAVASAERGHVTAWHVAYLLVLGVLLIVAAAMLRRRHGLVAASLLQPWVIAAGVVTWPMYVVGLLFAGIWVYYLRLWRPLSNDHGQLAQATRVSPPDGP